MLLMTLQCWCEMLMWLLPDDATSGAAPWLLPLMWDSQHGLKRVSDWLVLWSQLAIFVIVNDYPVSLIDWFISQFLWLIRWLARSPVDESYSQQSSELQLKSCDWFWSDGWPGLQLKSPIHSSLLNYNWIVMWLIFITFLKFTDWLNLNVTHLI